MYIKNKNKKTVLCKKTQHIKDYNEKEKREIEKKTNYKERERDKEGRERITRCKFPTPSPIIKGTSKKSKQHVIRSILSP